MHTTANNEFGTGKMPGRGTHCTREQARAMLEELRMAYQSLPPAERIVIRSIITQSARTQFTQEMNEENRVREVVC